MGVNKHFPAVSKSIEKLNMNDWNQVFVRLFDDFGVNQVSFDAETFERG